MNPMTEEIYYKQKTKARGLVLCFHGFTSSPYMFRELASHLHAERYDVFCPLTPGHGTSQVVDVLDFDIDGIGPWFDSIGNIVGQYDVVYLIGSSFGSLLALYYSQVYPVKKTILCALPLRIGKSWPFSKLLSFFAPALGRQLVFWDRGRKFAGFPAKHGHAQYPIKVLFLIEGLKKVVKSHELRSQTILLANKADKVVSMASLGLFASWFKNQKSLFELLTFEEGLKIPHDMIDQSHHRHKNGFAISAILDLLG